LFEIKFITNVYSHLFLKKGIGKDHLNVIVEQTVADYITKIFYLQSFVILLKDMNMIRDLVKLHNSRLDNDTTNDEPIKSKFEENLDGIFVF